MESVLHSSHKIYKQLLLFCDRPIDSNASAIKAKSVSKSKEASSTDCRERVSNARVVHSTQGYLAHRNNKRKHTSKKRGSIPAKKRVNNMERREKVPNNAQLELIS